MKPSCVSNGVSGYRRMRRTTWLTIDCVGAVTSGSSWFFESRSSLMTTRITTQVQYNKQTS